MKKKTTVRNIIRLLWEGWCIGSIIGIWPRYIEPNLIKITRLHKKVPFLSPEAKIEIAQLSDLHINPSVPEKFLEKIIKKVQKTSPDLIVITGDFLCHSRLTDHNRLKKYLRALVAIAPVFAVLGNHDYSSYLTVGNNGEYTTARNEKTDIINGFQRLFQPLLVPSGKVSLSARSVTPNQDLLHVFKEVGVQFLHNETHQFTIGKNTLNVTGLGEHMAGLACPKTAYQNYVKTHPGITLLHNPDALPSLANTPGQMIFCGHTHGGSIYLPWIWKKITVIENQKWVRGHYNFFDKSVYINRGLRGVFTFRWFSIPEIVHCTLESIA